MSRPLLRRVTEPLLRHTIRRSLGRIEGLAHIPPSGAFVLVPNHTSYLDHFVLIFLLEAMRDGAISFLTKKESFRSPMGRAWAEAWNGVPVDRDRPSVATLKRVREVLLSGEALCVYPEGTRSPSAGQLGQFKPGAFRFAVDEAVPVIPVIIVGADQVLPRGSIRPRKGVIDVRFGPSLVGDPSVTKRLRGDRIQSEARAWMERSIAEVSTRRARDEVDELGITERVTDVARRGELTVGRRRSIQFVIAAVGANSPRTLGPRKARARVAGLAALHGPRVLKPLSLRRVRRGLDYALRVSPGDVDAHYYLGVAHASHRGGSSRAREHFQAAIALSNGAEPRSLLAWGQLEAREGNAEHSRELFLRAVDALDPSDPRSQARKARLELLIGGHDAV